MSNLWKLTLSAVVLVMAGCGDPGPYRIAVTGMLTLDGKPFPFKSLTFIPTDGTPGHGAAGYSDGEGRYRLQSMVPGALRDYRGCPPGRYLVVVEEPMIPITGSQSAVAEQPLAESSDEPAPAIGLIEPRRRRAKGGIPPIYASERTTPLVVEVAEGGEVIDLVLESKTRPSLASTKYQRGG